MANWIRVMTANLPASMVAKFSDEKGRRGAVKRTHIIHAYHSLTICYPSIPNSSRSSVRAVVMHETEGMKVVPEYSGIIDEDVVKQRYFYPTDNIPVMVAGAENVGQAGVELRMCLHVVFPR